MLNLKRPQRTLAGVREVRGVSFFLGADVSLRFSPAEPDTGVVFVRTDLPDRPSIPARIDHVVPSPRRTTIQHGPARVEMIEHVMAALAGSQVDNCQIEIDGPECPGLDGSSQILLELLDAAGIVEQDRPRPALELERSYTVRDGDAVLAAHPASGQHLTLSYHLDYGRDTPIGTQSYFLELTPQSFRTELAPSRTFLLESEALALRAAGIGRRTTERDVLIFGKEGVLGNALRYPEECARHKILDMVGDFALLGMDLHGFVVAHRSGHHANASLVRKLRESVERDRIEWVGKRAREVPLQEDGRLDIQGILEVLPHRYPLLLIDRVLELEPGHRIVAVKNVSSNEPYFQGHWPGRPIMPGVLILEAMAQAAGVLIATRVSHREHIAMIASMDEIKLRRPVVPGDQLRLEIVGQRIKASTAIVSGIAKVDDVVAAEAKIRFVIVAAELAA